MVLKHGEYEKKGRRTAKMRTELVRNVHFNRRECRIVPKA